MWSSVIHPAARTHSCTKPRSRIQRCSRVPGRSACPSIVVWRPTPSSWNSGAWSSPKSCCTARCARSRAQALRGTQYEEKEALMSRRSLASTAALSVGVIALLAQAPVDGQTQSAASKPTAAARPWTPPRTADGKPDLQGIYTDNTVTPFERPKQLGTKEFYTDQEFAELAKRARQGDIGEEGNLGAANPQEVRYDLELYGFDRTKVRFGANKRTSLIIGPEGVVPPMLPEARTRNAERVARNKGHEFDSHENRPLSERCILLNQERIPLIPGA